MSNILMTPEEIRDLKRMCNDPFLELGMTLRPKHLECFKPKIATNSIRIIIKFEEHKDAEKWNKMHETQIRRGGHLATITLTTLAYTLGGGAAISIATGSTVAILKDEVQAHIWYPKMFKGWLLTRHYIFRYEQFPNKNFYMEWTDIIQDETGKEQERRKHGQSHIKVGGPSGIPEELVRNIITSYPLHTVNYK